MITFGVVERALESPKKWKAFKEGNQKSLAEVDFTTFNLDGYDFSGLDLENCNFTECELTNCNFSRTNLYGSNFRQATIRDTSYAGAILTSSDFSDTELFDVDFSGAEATDASFHEANFLTCELARSRGLSQYSIEVAVGDTTTSIPQFLGYPDHWLQNDDEREETAWKRRLSAFRGDDIVLCVFDGATLKLSDFGERDREEIRHTLEHQQRQLRYAFDDKLMHNECPSVFRAIQDYFNVLTSSAGEGKPRWPLKLHEIEEIKIGLEGLSLLGQIEAFRLEMQNSFPGKVAQINQIVSTHLLLVSGMERWKAFLHGAGEARLVKGEKTDLMRDKLAIEGISLALASGLEGLPNEVDQKLPTTIRTLVKFLDKPAEVARLGAYGIARCIESAFSAVFTFVRRMMVATGEEVIKQVPKNAVRLLVGTMLAAGASGLFAFFPHLTAWLSGGLGVLRSLGIIS